MRVISAFPRRLPAAPARGARAGRTVGSHGRVIAFEANPDLVKLIADSACINGYPWLVAVHNLAVGDATGEATFYVRERHLGNSSLAGCPQAALDHLHDAVREVRVRTVALDDRGSPAPHRPGARPARPGRCRLDPTAGPDSLESTHARPSMAPPAGRPPDPPPPPRSAPMIGVTGTPHRSRPS